MAVSKVNYGSTTLIDLTSDTVNAANLAEGYTAHDKSGAVITGTMVSGHYNVVQNTLESGNDQLVITDAAGGSFLEHLLKFQISPNTTATEIVANIPNVNSLYNSFSDCKNTNIQKIELTVTERLTTLQRLFNNAAIYKLEEIVFHGDLSKVKTLSYAFACGGTGANYNLRKITGLDFTSVTDATNAFASQWGIVDLEIKADTINVSLLIDSKRLSAASCVNVLNALKDRTDMDALTLSCRTELKDTSTGKLYINYVKLNGDTGLYVSCEQTDDGAMTIAAAITAKNWTIA